MSEIKTIVTEKKNAFDRLDITDIIKHTVLF